MNENIEVWCGLLIDNDATITEGWFDTPFKRIVVRDLMHKIGKGGRVAIDRIKDLIYGCEQVRLYEYKRRFGNRDWWNTEEIKPVNTKKIKGMDRLIDFIEASNGRVSIRRIERALHEILEHAKPTITRIK